MSDGEDDGVRQVHLVGVFVYGGRDDWRVDDDGVIGGQRFAAQLHAGVLRGQVAPDVFVEDEGDADLTCGEKKLRCDGGLVAFPPIDSSNTETRREEPKRFWK